MLIPKQKYYFILLVFLMVPIAVKAAWSEPSQAPTGGNAALPIYSEGSGQILNGTLHVDPSAANATSLQGSGSTNGVQGNSVGNALFGNLTNNGAGGGRAVYGLAVDASDYGLYTGGGLGVGVASGDIWFLQQDQGLAWPRESDGASLYGVYVTNTGELQVRGHGAGINLMDQNAASRLTVSEAGVVNVAAGGSLTVNTVPVCLADGTNCQSPPPPPPPPAGADLWNPNGNDAYPNFSGNTRLNHVLQFNGDTGAEAAIDFDPFQGNLGNYFIIQSGISATYGLKEHLRINREGQTLLGGNLFIGKGNGISSMTPFTEPTNDASWKIGLVGGVNTIETNPGGDAGSIGNINLKSGTLSAGSVNLSNDAYLQNNKSIRVDNANANTTILLANYSDNNNPPFGYGTGKTASLAVEGDVKGNRLCFGDADCKASWGEIVQGGGGGNWTLSGNGVDLYPSSNNYNVGIGNSAPGAYKLNVSGSVALGALGTLDSLDASNFYINGKGDVQIRVDSDNNGSNSFKINDGSLPGGATVFSVNESGNMVVTGTSNQIGGAFSAVPLAVKTNSGNSQAIVVECGLGGCDNSLQLYSNNANYAVMRAVSAGGGKDLILQPNIPAFPDGRVAIGGFTDNPANANGTLHIKSDAGNAEFDIQTTGSPYWGIYQDDTTDELRFWNNNIANNKNALTFNATTGDVVANNNLGVGTVPSWRFHVSDMVNQYAAEIDGNMVITGNKSLCLDSDCKNDWGPNTGNTFIRTLQPVDGLDYDCTKDDNLVAKVGYVMIGIRNTNPAKLICARMW